MADSESPQNLYAKNLRQTFGYPLRYPEPKPGLPASYAENGLHIGDVGYVDEEGMFIVRFNICSSLDHDLHQARRTELAGLVGLTTFDPNEASPVPNAFPSDRVISHGVRSPPSDDKSKYPQKFMSCSRSGAILILPSGALRQKLDKEQEEEFRTLAEKYALSWSKAIRCKSLYLITGFYKANSWYLASFHDAGPTGQVLLTRDGSGDYTWDLVCDYRQSSGENHSQNQTVLVSGFKIEVREWDGHIWVEQLPSRSNVWSKLVFLMSSLLHILDLSWTWIQRSMGASARVVRTPALSPPFHPSDVINRYLLHKNPKVQVAITHDSRWLSMLEENEISHGDIMEREKLWAFLEAKYTDGTDSVDVAYLRRKTYGPNSEGNIDECKLTHSSKMFFLPPVTGDTRQLVITCMRAENSVTCLRRLPIGFYVLVQFNNIKRWSKCKPALLSNGPFDSVIEWDDEIILPTDPIVEVEFSLHASFEFSPILGNGEILYVFRRSVGSLAALAHVGSIFLVWNVKNTSSSASLLITIEERSFHPLLNWSHDDGKLGSEDSSCVEVREATDNGHNALLHFHCGQGTEMLEKCVEYFSLALNCCPVGHERYAVTLFNFATAKFISYQVHGTTADLNLAVTSYRRALWLRSYPHPDRPGTLVHLAQALLHHQMKVQHGASSTDEIKKFAVEAQQTCPENSYDYRAAMLVLQTLKRSQASASGKLDALDELIPELRWSADAPPSLCLDRPYRLVNLSIALRKRFEITGDLDYLERSISAMEEAMQLTPDDHFDKPWRIASLGDALRTRFVQRSVVADLDSATSMIADALRMTPDGHYDKPWMLASLGNALHVHFLRHSALVDLDNAISLTEDALKLTPDGHFYKPRVLTSLGNMLRTRFLRCRVVADLDRAIFMIDGAVKATLDGHFHKPWMLASLCSTFRARFLCHGVVTDLDSAISVIKDTVKATPDDHPYKPWVLASFGDTLHIHSIRHGIISNLDNGISVLEDAVKLVPDCHFDKPFMFASLADILRTRFTKRGVVTDLDNAISITKGAMKVIPDDHFDKPRILTFLGDALRLCFLQRGAIADLDRAISIIWDAVKVTPDDHFDKPKILVSLGTALRIRFLRSGNITDLDNAISVTDGAVRATLDGHFHKPWMLASFSDVLRVRFLQRGAAADLDSTISMIENAINLTPDDHLDKVWMIASLGHTICIRFVERGIATGLNNAIFMVTNAVKAARDGNLDNPFMCAFLGDALCIGHGSRRDVVPDLDSAISVIEEAVKATPDGHFDKPWMFASLGNALRVRFEQRGIVADLDNAISIIDDAVKLAPDGHFYVPWMLASLRHALRVRSAWRKVAARNDLTYLEMHQSILEIHHVIFIGDTGSGKSSLINLVAVNGGQLGPAAVSCDGTPRTVKFASYDVLIEGRMYRLWDTPGLNQPLGWRSFQERQPSTGSTRQSIDILDEFLRERRLHGELDLLVLCVRGTDKTHTRMVEVYNRLCRPNRQKAMIPVVIVITHLEEEQPTMDMWWQNNKARLREMELEFDGYGCVTCLYPHRLRRFASHTEIRSLISQNFRQRRQPHSTLNTIAETVG